MWRPSAGPEPAAPGPASRSSRVRARSTAVANNWSADRLPRNAATSWTRRAPVAASSVTRLKPTSLEECRWRTVRSNRAAASSEAPEPAGPEADSRRGYSDQRGGFSLTDVVPGDYQVLAWEDIEDGAFEDPEILKKYQGSAESLSLKQNDRRTLQVTAIPVEQVH